MKTARTINQKFQKTHFLLSKVRSLKFCPSAILMPLEENPKTVPHLNALISGKKFWGRQRCDSSLSVLNALLKISILLHQMPNVCRLLKITVANILYPRVDLSAYISMIYWLE